MLKNIPKGPKGEGLRGLKKKAPELVKQRFGYKKKGGMIKKAEGGALIQSLYPGFLNCLKKRKRKKVKV